MGVSQRSMEILLAKNPKPAICLDGELSSNNRKSPEGRTFMYRISCRTTRYSHSQVGRTGVEMQSADNPGSEPTAPADCNAPVTDLTFPKTSELMVLLLPDMIEPNSVFS